MRASSPTSARIGAKRGSRTKARIFSEKTDVNARRCRNGLPSWSLPKKSGIPKTRVRPDARHSHSMRSISPTIIATSSAVATRENWRKP